MCYRTKMANSKYFGLLVLGMLINSAYIMANRFLVEIPDGIAITIELIAIAFMLAGLFLTRFERGGKRK